MLVSKTQNRSPSLQIYSFLSKNHTEYVKGDKEKAHPLDELFYLSTESNHDSTCARQEGGKFFSISIPENGAEALGPT